jgi:hypothetical protein
MTRYFAELAVFILCLVLIYTAPEASLSVIVLSLPVIALCTGLSVLYLHRVYVRQPTPRSRFFGMLVGVSTRSWIAGLWVGYLVIGRVLDRMAHEGFNVWQLPTPPPNVSAPISGLVVAYLMLPPIIYALTVWSVRRRAGNGTALEREGDLDRQDGENS